MVKDVEKFESCLNKLNELNVQTQAKIDNNVSLTYEDLHKYDKLTRQMELLIIKEEV